MTQTEFGSSRSAAPSSWFWSSTCLCPSFSVFKITSSRNSNSSSWKNEWHFRSHWIKCTRVKTLIFPCKPHKYSHFYSSLSPTAVASHFFYQYSHSTLFSNTGSKNSKSYVFTKSHPGSTLRSTNESCSLSHSQSSSTFCSHGGSTPARMYSQ